MQREQFLDIIEQMNLVCKQVNSKVKSQNPKSKLVYEVLQSSDLAKAYKDNPQKLIKAVADFYNHNWRGNTDFMHIPSFEQVMSNISKYPIIIAREEDKDEILAISTIKYDENSSEQIDPYFPISNAKYFSITGILTRENAPYKGMGKKIYEIALRGASQYNKKHSGTRMMCVIDSRNAASFNALSSAVKNINSEETVGNSQGLPASVVGYYELSGKKGNLLEAPTLVLEVGLNPEPKSSLPQKGVNLRFFGQKNIPLFQSIQQKLHTKLRNFGLNSPIVHTDPDAGKVSFHPLEQPCSITKTRIFPGNTAKGNNRIPWEKDPTEVETLPKDVPIYFKPNPLSYLKAEVSPCTLRFKNSIPSYNQNEIYFEKEK